MKGRGGYMHVNSVSMASAQGFEGKKKAQKQVVITPERFANMDDRDLKILANHIASERVNDKKHRKINNALFYNLPLAGGLATLATAGKATRLGKLGAFAGSTLGWTAGLLVADGIISGKHALERKSSKVREFNKNHPIISTLGVIGTIFAGMIFGGRGIAKLGEKVLPKIQASKLYAQNAPKVIRLTEKAGTVLENNKILNVLSKGLEKVPSSIKSFGKILAVNAPLMLVLGQLGHAFNHRAIRDKVAMDTFAELKESQDVVRENLMNEEA